MAKRIRIYIKDEDTNINFSLPIGLFSRLTRLGVDLASLFKKQVDTPHFSIKTKDAKMIADFIDAIKTLEPFTLVEVHDNKSHVVIRTE